MLAPFWLQGKPAPCNDGQLGGSSLNAKDGQRHKPPDGTGNGKHCDSMNPQPVPVGVGETAGEEAPSGAGHRWGPPLLRQAGSSLRQA